MISKVTGLGIFGLDSFCVDVETDVSSGLPRFDAKRYEGYEVVDFR